MNMALKIGLGFSVIAGCTVAAVPNIYSSKINEFISDSQKSFEIQGITSDVQNSNDTYFNVQREYNITIADSSYILKNIGLDIGSSEFKDIKKILDDTAFSFSLNLPKYPSSQKDAIVVSLKELSPNVQMALNKDELGREIINFIENKGILLTLSLDNFSLKKAKLKDIDLNLKNNDQNKTKG